MPPQPTGLVPKAAAAALQFAMAVALECGLLHLAAQELEAVNEYHLYGVTAAQALTSAGMRVLNFGCVLAWEAPVTGAWLHWTAGALEAGTMALFVYAVFAAPYTSAALPALAAFGFVYAKRAEGRITDRFAEAAMSDEAGGWFFGFVPWGKHDELRRDNKPPSIAAVLKPSQMVTFATHVVALALSLLAATLEATFMMSIADEVLYGTISAKRAVLLVLVFFAAQVGKRLLERVEQRLHTSLSSRLRKDFSSRLLDNLLSSPVFLVETMSDDELRRRAELLPVAVADFYMRGTGVAKRVQQAVAIVVGMPLLLWLSWRMTLVHLLMTLNVLGDLQPVGDAITSNKMQEARRVFSEGNRKTNQAILHMRTVKALGAEQWVADHLQHLGNVFMGGIRAREGINLLAGTFTKALDSAKDLLYLVAALEDARDRGTDRFPLSRALAWRLTINKVLPHVLELLDELFCNRIGVAGQETQEEVTECFTLLEHSRQGREFEAQRRSLDLSSVHGELELEEVEFAYMKPEGAPTPVLRGLSLRVPAGEMIGLVGKSGSGKSTVGALLVRLYKPRAGRILLDGQNIEQIKRSSIRRAIGFVPQDPVFFDDTLAQNICGGDDAANADVRARIDAALAAASAADFVNALAHGIDTPVGEGGKLFSGGQRGRLGLARTLYREPRVLFVDEATSQLDSNSEVAVMQNLERFARRGPTLAWSSDQSRGDGMQRGTVLVVAHRLAQMSRCHSVGLLEEGRLLERGAHSELIKRGGAYADLVRLQTIEGEDQ